MTNYNHTGIKTHLITNKNTLISLAFDKDIVPIVTAEFGNTIPYPHHLKVDKFGRVVYSWCIYGYFDTVSADEYLNDTIAKIKLVYQDKVRLIGRRTIEDKNTIKPVKLNKFNLNAKIKTKINEYFNYADNKEDTVFWALKLHAELLCRENSFFSYDDLLSYGKGNYADVVKDRSTLKAKCRNIFNWYLKRDFKPTVYVKKDKGEVMATRRQQAIKMHTKLAEDTKRKVLNVVTGMFAHEYKKANGKWNISKIAKDSGTTRPTVMKYLPKETLF